MSAFTKKRAVFDARIGLLFDEKHTWSTKTA